MIDGNVSILRLIDDLTRFSVLGLDVETILGRKKYICLIQIAPPRVHGARRRLADKTHALQDVVVRELDVDMNKGEQRSDWRQRPLTQAQISRSTTPPSTPRCCSTSTRASPPACPPPERATLDIRALTG